MVRLLSLLFAAGVTVAPALAQSDVPIPAGAAQPTATMPSSSAQAAPGLRALLAQGTPLVLSTCEALDSEKAEEGRQVAFRVERDVYASGGSLAVARGSRAFGQVVRAETLSPFGHRDRLTVVLETVDAVDGTSVPLRATRGARADDSFNHLVEGPQLLSPFFLFGTQGPTRSDSGALVSAFVRVDTWVAEAPSVHQLPARTLRVDTPDLSTHDSFDLSPTLQPSDPDAIYRVYVDGLLVATRLGSLQALPWNLQGHPRTLSPLLHSVQVEATCADGQLVVSPVRSLRLRDPDAGVPLDQRI